MPDPLFEEDDDANTPLTAEEREQLIPAYITLRHELNEAEQVNIGEALRWAMSRKRDVLDQDFLSQLHRRMFGDVWRWAGQYRTTPRNIGVDAYRIAMDVRQLVDDARYWVEHGPFRPMKPPYGSAIASSPSILFRMATDGSLASSAASLLASSANPLSPGGALT